MASEKMHTRGVRYNFEPSECVLCFEPDATKARVLYEAKVLTTHTAKDKHGNLKPEYTVHFQGWNSSWDRIVPETFIIKKSAENKALMKRLAMVARNVKKNRSRKRKIDILLKQHFKRKMPPDSSDSSTDDSTDEDDPDGDLSGDENDYMDRDDRMDTTTDEDGEHGTEELSEEDQEHSDGLERHGPHEVELDIPIELRSKLEDDCYFINRKKKLVALPSELNVINILEGYVKNFAVNILYGTVEKPRLRDHQNCPPEKSIDLCKEVMDGLRIFFDFTLPSILLYNVERPYFQRIADNFKPVTSIKKEPDHTDIPSPVVTSPRLRSSATKSTPPQACDTSPKLPRLSPKTVKRERLDDFSDDDLPPRRMTRHAYKAEIKTRKPGKHKHNVSDTSLPSTEKRPHSSRSESSDSGGDHSRRRESLRSSSRHTNDLNHSTAALVGLAQKAASLSDRVTPPPPLLIPSVISSKASKGSNSPRHTPTYKSKCSTPTLNDNDKEGMMKQVLEWHLIPEEVYQQNPPSPSLICGGTHLLRIFVRLPELLSQMSIPEAGLKALTKHLMMFLEYLADNNEEFIPESVYVEASDVLNKTPLSKR